jgi:hypothetical protein
MHKVNKKKKQTSLQATAVAAATTAAMPSCIDPSRFTSIHQQLAAAAANGNSSSNTSKSLGCMPVPTVCSKQPAVEAAHLHVCMHMISTWRSQS